MKKEILKLLLDNAGRFVSGEEISERFQVSRTAIWKHINSLKNAGYDIEALPRQGYRLKELPDVLNPEEVELSLKTRLLGRELHIYPELSSTNELAKKLAGEGSPEGTIVLAERQLRGRGRMGRSWHSPAEKGLWFTVILRPDIKPYLASQLIFVAAVGVCRALRKVTGLEVGIKWPNDLLVDGKKVCGILTELGAEIDMLNYIVLGIGININQSEEDFAPELAASAASLRQLSHRSYRRLEVLQEVLYQLETVYEQYLQEGFPCILQAWKELNCTLGQRVEVITRDEIYQGIAEDLNEDGSLLVRDEKGEIRTVVVGDISIRPRK